MAQAEASTPHLESNDSVDSPQVTIVLDNESTYFLPAKKLSLASQLFSDALQNGWSETGTNTVRLQEVKELPWILFTYFIQDERVVDKILDIIRSPVMTQQDVQDYEAMRNYVFCGTKEGITKYSPNLVIDRLIHAYNLGEYLGSPAFCNQVMDIIKDQYTGFCQLNGMVPLWNLEHVFRPSVSNRLSRLVSDCMVQYMSEKSLKQASDVGLIESHAFEAIALAVYRERDRAVWMQGRMPTHRDRCEYHDHEHPKADFKAHCPDDWESGGLGTDPAQTFVSQDGWGEFGWGEQ